MSETELRAPPSDLAAEQATLGAMLLEREAILEVRDILKPEDFYSPQHQTLYRRMLDLFATDQAVDVVTLQGALQDHGELVEVGGTPYLAALQDSGVTAAMIGRYSGVVRRKSQQRQIIVLAQRWRQEAYGADPEELCYAISREVYGISSSGAEGFEPLSEVLGTVLEQLERQVASEQHVLGIPTGLAKLDETISGWAKGTYNVIAARPGMGKTALALQQCIHAAGIGRSVALFSLEMSNPALGRRYIAHSIEVELRRVMTARFSRDRWDDIVEVCAKTAEWKFWLCKRADLRVAELRTQARRLAKKRGGLDLVVVDYLQLVGAEAHGSRNEIMTEVSHGVKALAIELDCAVLALSQLSRAGEQANREPKLSDLRDSGTIEQDADLVLFIDYPRWDKLFMGGETRPRKRRFDIAKHRNGPVGRFDVAWTEEFQRFAALDTQHEEQPYWAQD